MCIYIYIYYIILYYIIYILYYIYILYIYIYIISPWNWNIMKFHRNLWNNGNVKPPTSLRQHRHHRQMIPSGSSSCSFSCAGPRTYSWKWRWTQWPWPANDTWWLIPLSKWVITPVISGLTLLIPFITGVITHLLSGMSHQVGNMDELMKNLWFFRFFPRLGIGTSLKNFRNPTESPICLSKISWNSQNSQISWYPMFMIWFFLTMLNP